MNQVKTFRAASLHEALTVVRQEMGGDAVILDTRQVVQKRFLPWLRAKEQVEVTASLTAATSTGPVATPDSSNTLRADSDDTFSAVSDDSGLDLDHQLNLDDSELTPAAKAADIAQQLERRAADKNRFEETLKSLEDSFDEASLTCDLESAFEGDFDVDSPEGDSSISDSDSEILTTKIDALQKMVQSLTRSAHFRGPDEIPTELFEVYTHLLDADVDDTLARELIFRLREVCSADELCDSSETQRFLSRMVEQEISCTNPITLTPGKRRVVALVGPTGVGKTTTIAKLAANFRLRDGIRMGLVTVDTYRIAAVEQLRTYAEIIDLPMKVVTSPPEMRRALDDLAGLDLVLIDTAGRSPKDELKIQELRSMLSEAGVDEVHLVMSLTSSVRSISMTCELFEDVNPTALVLTKLDEAPGMGNLLSVSREVSLPVSYLTTGQDVPEDIEPANAARVSRLVLGEDRLFD